MFTLKGLEIHSSRMWRWASVRNALDFMTRFGLNALIFHQNDLTDQLVVPEQYIEGLEKLVASNLYPNRSEAIRIAIRDLLKRELWG